MLARFTTRAVAAPMFLSVGASTAFARRAKVTAFTGDEAAFDAMKAKGVTVVDFFADWCGPCRIAGPKFEALSDEAKYEGVAFVKANLDETEDIGVALGVKTIPAFAVFKDGKLVGLQEGEPLSKVEALIEKAKSH
jgi:thioredoxin 1